MNLIRLPRKLWDCFQLLTLMLLFCSGPFRLSGESEQLAPEGESAESVLQAEGTVLQPRARSDAFFPTQPSNPSMMGSLVLFLLMLAVVAGFWIYSKRGGSAMRQLGGARDLRIRETKTLGNRQFLVVVEYGEQRMLLGVAPGVINHLCYLESPESGVSAEGIGESTREN